MNADVLVVGAGPAGLAAAVELRRLGAGTVVVADRDDEAGGIPRHSAHTGFGARDLRRVLTGPGYARRYAGRGGGRRGGHPAGHHGDRLGRHVPGRRAARRWPVQRHADQPGRDRDRGRRGGAAGDRLPGAAPDGAPGPRRPAARGDDHRGTAAAGVPGGAAAARAGAGRRRGARQLLRHGHPGARRGAGDRAGHRPAPAHQLCRVRAGRVVALARAGVGIHRGPAGGRPGPAGGRRTRGPAYRENPVRAM